MPGIGIGISPVLGAGGGTPPVSDGELDAQINGTIGATTGAFTATLQARLGAAFSGTIGAVTGAFTAETEAGAAADQTLVVETFIADGTWTSPAAFQHPDGTVNAAQVELWAAGAGGTTNVGGGGGGAYARSKVTSLSPSTGYAVAGLAATAANTDAASATFNTTTVVADGGASGTNGGAGGTTAGSTGDTEFAGGNGTIAAGTQPGGGGAGDAAGGSGETGGAANGGHSASGALTGRCRSAGGGCTAGAGGTGGRGACHITYDTDAVAGFPRVRGRSWGRDASNATSRGATMPANIVAGELLVLVVSSDGNPTISVTGWTKVAQESSGTSVTLALFHKTAAGSDTATIATDASEMVAYQVWRIAGAGTPTWTASNASGANYNPPSHTPVAGSAKYLWIVAAAVDASALSIVTGIPANYANFIDTPGTTTAASHLWCFERFNEAASEDPGAITHSTEQVAGATISIPPA